MHIPLYNTPEKSTCCHVQGYNFVIVFIINYAGMEEWRPEVVNYQQWSSKALWCCYFTGFIMLIVFFIGYSIQLIVRSYVCMVLWYEIFLFW